MLHGRNTIGAPAWPNAVSAVVVLAMFLAVRAACGAPPEESLDKRSGTRSAGSDVVLPDATKIDPVIKNLVRQLGDPLYSVRERATRELRHLGTVVKPALIAALRNRDAEIRSRARRILTDVLEIDFQQRVSAFAADRDGGLGLSLPAWEIYQKLVGSDAADRMLFVDIIRAEPILLESVEQQVDYARQTLQSRAATLHEDYIRNPMFRGVVQTEQAGESSVLALLLAAAGPQVELDEYTATKIWQLVQHAGIRQQLEGGPRKSAVRKLIGNFIRRTANSALVYQTIWLAMHYDIEDGLAPAENIILRRDMQPYLLQNAILCVGKFGDKQHIEMLRPLLNETANADGRVESKNQPQLRDIALAVSIHLAGQNPKDFGFSDIQANSQMLFTPRSLAFSSDKERQAALAKWQDWLARTGDLPSAAKTRD